MNTEHLHILLTAIEKGSLAAAAEALDYTVSGISRSIAALERELGFTLLYRSKQGVTPTAECTMLLPSIREFLFADQRLAQTASAICGAEYGTLVIGTAYSSYYPWLTEMTAAFRVEHPNIQFHFISGASSDLFTRLQQHQLDFALASQRDGDFLWLPLLEDPQLAILPVGHPLANDFYVPVSAFAQEPFIETYPEQETDHSRTLEKCGVRPDIQYTTTDISATYAMVAAGLGISMNNQINSQMDYPNVVHLPLDPKQIISIGIACNKKLSPAASLFFEFLQHKLLHS